MPRNMSFTLTTDQIRNKIKTVTRRTGWRFLKPGEILNACVKCQGLKKGEKVEKICQIKVISVSREQLCCITQIDLRNEGFPFLTVSEFIDMFCSVNNCAGDSAITRIEFEYI